VAWRGVVADADAVADRELREGLGGADGLEKVKARADRFGERGEVRVERAGDVWSGSRISGCRRGAGRGAAGAAGRRCWLGRARLLIPKDCAPDRSL
jgi:hypothetical protein